MANFEITESTQKNTAWKVTGIHPFTGHFLSFQGGRKGTIIGGSTQRIAAFNARHEASGISPVKYVNALRWQGEALFGSIIEIPDELFNFIKL